MSLALAEQRQSPQHSADDAHSKYYVVMSDDVSDGIARNPSHQCAQSKINERCWSWTWDRFMCAVPECDFGFCDGWECPPDFESRRYVNMSKSKFELSMVSRAFEDVLLLGIMRLRWHRSELRRISVWGTRPPKDSSIGWRSGVGKSLEKFHAAEVCDWTIARKKRT